MYIQKIVAVLYVTYTKTKTKLLNKRNKIYQENYKPKREAEDGERVSNLFIHRQ